MKPYTRFFKKLLLLSLPLWVLLVVYLFLDPFKVLYHYPSYFKSGSPSYVTLDKDFVSTQTFINNSSEITYDAFIFGNSRSIFYEVDDWKKHIPSANCFHYDASSETLLGIHRKIKFLDSRQVRIAHALVVLDASILGSNRGMNGHIRLSHPKLSNQNWLSFELEFFKSFLAPKFLVAYLDFSFTHKFKEYMRQGLILDDRPLDYDVRSNEIQYSEFEKMIRENPASFYDQKKMKVFQPRPTQQQYSTPCILAHKEKMLGEIAEKFKRDSDRSKSFLKKRV